jgi:UDP-3-O-[3-hydroxymyristoyl] glucosamine N-acyltransferase LpxD
MPGITAKIIIEFCERLFSAKITNLVGDFSISTVCPIDKALDYGLGFVTKIPDDVNLIKIPSRFVVIAPKGAEIANGILIEVDNPKYVFAKILAEFFSRVKKSGVASSAVIETSSNIHPTAVIGEFCYIGPNCEIAEHVVIHHNTVLYDNVRVGKGSVILSGCVIGENGFGVVEDGDGNLQCIPHIGGVRIGEHVQIGSLNSIASGTLEPTVIGDYTKTDNLVHIAHNVKIGKNCQITACAEISGSVTIGDRVWISPNASVIQKVSIGDRGFIGIGSAVTKSVDPFDVVAGVPAKKIRRLGDDNNG